MLFFCSLRRILFRCHKLSRVVYHLIILRCYFRVFTASRIILMSRCFRATKNNFLAWTPMISSSWKSRLSYFSTNGLKEVPGMNLLHLSGNIANASVWFCTYISVYLILVKFIPAKSSDPINLIPRVQL